MGQTPIKIDDEHKEKLEQLARKNGKSESDVAHEAIDFYAAAQPSNGSPTFDFWKTQTLDELASLQGVKPVSNLAELAADFWPEDEDPDEFTHTIRRWRAEGRTSQ